MAETRNTFEAFVIAARPRLLARARSILHDGDEAEDVVQETLTSVWHRLSDRPPRDLRAYVFRAVEVNSLKRRARRRPHVALEAAAAMTADDGEIDPRWTIDPWTLEQAVVGLPTAQQTVLRMKYYLGLTFREIGETLAISANTAASRCRYGLESLRRHFERTQTEKEKLR